VNAGANQKEPVAPEDLAFAAGAGAAGCRGLVGDLLDTTLIDADQFPLRPSTVDLGALVQGVLDSFSPRFTPTAWSPTCPPNRQPSPPTGETPGRGADELPGQCRQVRPGDVGHRRAHHPRRPGRARVSVSDAGPGITAASQARLFQRFYRAPETAEKSARRGPGPVT